MKKIINGKLYDTNTAKELGLDNGGDGFRHWCETLYLKRTGEYFLHGAGGPMTKYAQSVGQNSWSEGEKIIPLSAENARKWAEEHLDADDYEEIFGLPSEDDSKVTLCIQIPAVMDAKLRAGAEHAGTSLTAYVQSLISAAL